MTDTRELASARKKQIADVLYAFSEQRIALYRVGLLLAVVLWSLVWHAASRRGWSIDEQAIAVTPFAIGMLLLSIGWLVYLEVRQPPPSPRLDVLGAAFNIIGLGVLLHFAWNLLLPMAILAPLVCVGLGTRTNTRIFYLALLAGVATVLIAAPDRYFIDSPVFAVVGMCMLWILPVAISRLVGSIMQIAQMATVALDAQTRFLGMMNHELRTPLNAIINSAVILGARDHDATSGRLIETIESESRQMLNNVQDLIDVTLLESDRVTLDDGAFRPAELMRELTSSFEGKARSAEVSLSFDGQGDTAVKGDAHRVRQVAWHLIDNAIKYTPAGGRVWVSCQVDIKDDLAQVRLSVGDTGIGIQPAAAQAIFRPFTQLSIGEARSHQGTGTGLYIVRALSNLMAADLTMDSAPNQGTRFEWVCAMPVWSGVLSHDTPTAPAQAIADHHALSLSLRCLVVDDQESSSEIARRFLEFAGHPVSVSSSGRDALRRLREVKHDVVLLDYYMPGMNGLDVLKALQSDSGITAPPVIVLSAAVSQSEALDECLKAGALCCLGKPFDLVVLLGLLEIVAAGGSLAIMRSSIEARYPLVGRRSELPQRQ